MTNPHDNPIGFLQEFVQKYNVSTFPEYTEYEASGPSHARKFQCCCTYHGYEVKAHAPSKKQAKRQAAQNLITLLNQNNYFEKYNILINSAENEISKNTSLNISNEQPQTTKIASITSKNPISLLQEYCQSKHCELPIYVESTNSLTTVFSVVCEVGDSKTCGSGHTKKIAKLQAAEKMCILLNISAQGGVPKEVFRSYHPIEGSQAGSSRLSLPNDESQDRLMNHSSPVLEELVLSDSEDEAEESATPPKNEIKQELISVKLENLTLDDTTVEIDPEYKPVVENGVKNEEPDDL